MLRLLYWLYKSRLRRQIGGRQPPRHVGIILDGNRRYARKHGLADPGVAYDLGAEKLDDVLAWCSDLGIPAVTLWVCSIDNLKRQEGEVSAILAAVKPKIGALANDPVIHRRRVRVKAVGRLDLLPPTLVTVLREAERATADYDSLKLTIAIAYGGHEEIADAVRGLVRQKMQCGVDLDAIVDEITPRRSLNTSCARRPPETSERQRAPQRCGLDWFERAGPCDRRRCRRRRHKPAASPRACGGTASRAACRLSREAAPASLRPLAEDPRPSCAAPP